MIYPKETLEKRYLNDPEFHAVVKFLESAIKPEFGLTSLDIRDAAFYARIRFEMRYPQPICISPEMADLLLRECKIPEKY